MTYREICLQRRLKSRHVGECTIKEETKARHDTFAKDHCQDANSTTRSIKTFYRYFLVIVTIDKISFVPRHRSTRTKIWYKKNQRKARHVKFRRFKFRDRFQIEERENRSSFLKRLKFIRTK